MAATGDKSSTILFVNEPKIQIMLVLLIAFLARMLCVILFGDIDISNATTWTGSGTKIWEYGRYALNYMETGTISRQFVISGETLLAPTAYIAPGHIFLWIVLFKIFGVTSNAMMAMLVLNILTGVLLVYLTYRFTLEVSNDHYVSLATAIIIGLYPTFVYSVATYHAIQTYLALFLSFMIVFIKFIKEPSYKLAIALGLLAAITALWRTEFAFFIVILLIMALIRNRNFKWA